MEDTDVESIPTASIRAMPVSMIIKKSSFVSSVVNLKEKLNWLIHVLFMRQEYDECLRIIEDMLHESKGRSEYALYAKALILRVKGEIHESLALFKKCHMLNPTYLDYLK
jgi:Bardet-Biedl syndrome 4 protein